MNMKRATVALRLALAPAISTFAQDEQAELAKKLANPVASLISMPLQLNYDENIGPNEDGSILTCPQLVYHFQS